MSTLTQADTKTYSIDPSHSRVAFTVRHLGFSKVRGSFEDFEGTVRLNTSDLSTLNAEGTVQAASIVTGDDKRDAHLRSEDFFGVEEYPTIRFDTAGVRSVDGETFTVDGDLSIHGTTNRVTLTGEFLGEGADPWGGTRIALELGTKINRKDYGLNWNAVLETGGVLVSEEVDITLEIQAVLQDQDQ